MILFSFYLIKIFSRLNLIFSRKIPFLSMFLDKLPRMRIKAARSWHKGLMLRMPKRPKDIVINIERVSGLGLALELG